MMRTLDEYDEVLLRQELERRDVLRRNGLCDYCERPPYVAVCRFPERHNNPVSAIVCHIAANTLTGKAT